MEAHVTELVGGRSADNGDLALDVSAVRQLVDDVHLDFLSEVSAARLPFGHGSVKASGCGSVAVAAREGSRC